MYVIPVVFLEWLGVTCRLRAVKHNNIVVFDCAYSTCISLPLKETGTEIFMKKTLYLSQWNRSNIWTDPSIYFAVPLRILPAKESKINKQCVISEDKWNRMCSLTLNLEQINLHKDRIFSGEGWNKDYMVQI